MHKLRVLMTGGSGFLGSHLARRLTECGADVVVLKREKSRLERIADLTDSLRFYSLENCNLGEVFQQERPQVVLHCATHYGRNDAPPLDIIAANLQLPLQLLQLSQACKTPVFINTDTILDKRVSYYTLSKKQFLEWMILFSKTQVCVNVALEHFYGPGDDPSKFVTMILDSLIRETDAIRLTEGQQKRDFIYISDVVDAFMKIIEHSKESPTGMHNFELGCGKNITIRDFVHLACDLTGNQTTELKFGELPYRENEVMETRVDLEAIHALGWSPRIDLQAGLLQTIQDERKRILQ